MPPRLPGRASLQAAAAVAVFAYALVATPAHAVYTNGKLQVIHLDAGQGDGACIITPGGQVALIDEGTNFTAGTSPPSCPRVLSELQALGVTHVDLHFASHYHADHIGCITSLSGITIDAGWDRAESYSSTAYTNYVNYLGTKRHTLVKGQVFTLDSLSAHPVKITCVALNGDGISTSDENSQSLVLKVSYGEYDEVFGGDLTGYPQGSASSNTNIETQVGPEVGKVEVYKVHHHGSAYGSYDDWLNATQPKIGIISCGTGNGYGHPTQSALTRLHAHNVRTYWTETGSGAAPIAPWDKVANNEIRINAVWDPAGVDSIIAPGIADTITNSGTAVDGTPPVVTVVSPNGGESLAAGGSTSITWSATDNVGVTSVDVAYSLDNGGSWTNVGTGLANSGSVSWNVPNTLTSQGLVRVTARDGAGNSAADASNSNYAIADHTAPTVAVTSPNGGESLPAGGSTSITWSAADNIGVASVDVAYSLDNGGSWSNVGTGLANSGSASWSVPNAVTSQGRVRVTARDAANNTTSDASNAVYSITDQTAPTVAVTSPNGGESLPAGGSTNITWNASDNIGVASVDVAYSLNHGGSWTNIGTGLANSGSLSWSVPNTTTSQGLVRVTARDAATHAASDVSNSDFAIADGTLPTVAVTSPNGGETLAAGVATTVTWSASDNIGVTAVDAAYSLDNGANWTAIATGIPNSGTLSWNVPNAVTQQGLVRITAHDGSGNAANDVSNATYSITDQTAPTVSVTAPNGGESFTAGATEQVAWNAADNIGVTSVDVDYSLHGLLGPWAPILHGIANSGSVDWTVPDSSTDSAAVRVTASDQAANQQNDASDALFHIASGAVSVGGGPAHAEFALRVPAPTPTGGRTTLRFSLARSAPATLAIVDVNGRVMWRSGPAELGPGEHVVVWNGGDTQGAPLRSGVYFVRLESAGNRAMRKLVLMR